MNETLLWLLYFLSGAAAFAIIFFQRWPITAAMLIGTSVTIAGWAFLYLLAAEDSRPEWWKLDLSLNACFGLIFAAAGAALAHVLLLRNRGT